MAIVVNYPRHPSWHQSAIGSPSCLVGILICGDPWLHRSYPVSALLRSPPTSVAATVLVIHSQTSHRATPWPPWISQVPRSSSLYTPSACTPEDWIAAYAYDFAIHAGVALLGGLAIPIELFEAETGSHFRIMACTVRLLGLRPVGYPSRTPSWLHVHRHVHGRDFHSTRWIRLFLTRLTSS
jgi:hypothetical protein